MIQEVILKKLKDEGYYLDIRNRAFSKETLKENPPSWESLYRGDLSDKEYEYVDTEVKKFIHEPLYAPNGFHEIGVLKDLYGQENIDRQVETILGNPRPMALIWFLTIKKTEIGDKNE